jgi:tetratricopeptide (TPR) repeat protein
MMIRHGARRLITAIVLALAYCMTSADGLPPAIERLNQERLADLRVAAQGVEAHTKDGAILRYHIAELSRDYEATGRVVKQLEQLRDKYPDDAEILAFLGSAVALRARDFPLRGLYQVVPGPGFVRMGNTSKAISLLQEAVDSAPQNPIVRLVRGITLTHLPRPFLQFGEGLADLRRLARWVDNPSLNSGYADILRDPAFQADVFFRLGEAYALDGNDRQSRGAYQRAAAVAPPGSPVAVAAEALSQ